MCSSTFFVMATIKFVLLFSLHIVIKKRTKTCKNSKSRVGELEFLFVSVLDEKNVYKYSQYLSIFKASFTKFFFNTMEGVLVILIIFKISTHHPFLMFHCSIQTAIKIMIALADKNKCHWEHMLLFLWLYISYVILHPFYLLFSLPYHGRWLTPKTFFPSIS